MKRYEEEIKVEVQLKENGRIRTMHPEKHVPCVGKELNGFMITSVEEIEPYFITKGHALFKVTDDEEREDGKVTTYYVVV